MILTKCTPISPAPFTFSHRLFFLFMVLLSCNNDGPAQSRSQDTGKVTTAVPEQTKDTRYFRGAFSNGMKGDSIFFNLSPDGKRMENLTFKGYWRCSGKLEQIVAGPGEAFGINAGKIKGHISEPPDGGSTAWRFDLEATINEHTAAGSFRMNINNLGCDTYKLQWTAMEE